MRCDCGAFETCDVCIALAERDLGPYTAEDYARHQRIVVPRAVFFAGEFWKSDDEGNLVRETDRE